ncbi:MAG: twin-arginine translocase TatA/TatE family subunit [Nitriliruptoraceae bacterium]
MPGPQELVVIALIALVVFGPDRLPEMARNAGKWLGRLRSETARNVEELKRLSEIQQLQADLKGLKRELDDARRDVTDGVKELSGLGGSDRSAAARRRSAERPTLPVRASDDPPPFDPEAT